MMQLNPVITALSLTLAAALAASQGTDVFSPGPYPPGRIELARLTHLGLDHNLVVHAPNATGQFPVLYFSSGFAGS